MEFVSVSGEVLKYVSSPLINESSYTAFYDDDGFGITRNSIVIIVRVESSSRETFYPLYNPLQVTELITRMIDGPVQNDVRFMLYRKKPSTNGLIPVPMV